MEPWIAWHEGGLVLAAPPVARPPGVDAVLPTSWPLRPLHAVVLAWVAALVAAGPRQREPWILALGAALLAWVLTPVRILMGVDYAYVRWADGTGAVTASTLYGDTWASLAGLVWWLSGGVPDHVQHLNLVLGAITVALVHDVGRRLGGVDVGRMAALMLAASPLHLALARTETMFVLVTTLQVATLAGILREDAGGSVLAVGSAVLLAWLRPLQLVAVAALAGVAWGRGRRRTGTLLAGAFASRAVPLAVTVADHGPPQAAGTRALGKWLEPHWFVGPGGSSVVLDPLVVPPVLAVLVVAALATRPRRAVATVGVVALAACLPYLHFERPTDVLRFQLPTATWWIVLAALGWVRLGPGMRVAALALLVAGTVAARQPLGAPFLWQLEEQALREALPAHVPPGATGWTRAPWDRHQAFALWLNSRGPGRWRTQGQPAPGDLVWHGRGDAWPGASPACEEEVLWSRQVTVRVGDVEPIDADVVTFALARVLACPPEDR